MTAGFADWFTKIFRKKDKRLYHEWLVDQLFDSGELTDKQRNKVMLLIHESLLEGFFAGPVVIVTYCDVLQALVKVPSGRFKGEKMSDLPNTDQVWKEISRLKRVTNDYIVRQACTAKLNEIQVQRDWDRQASDKRNRHRK